MKDEPSPQQPGALRVLLQSLAEYACPVRQTGLTPPDNREIYLRPLLVLAIVALCGPEVFAAADLVALLDLMGVMLFLTAFDVGCRVLGLAFLARLRNVLFPSEWLTMIKARGHPSVIAQGLLLVGANVLWISFFCLLTSITVVEVVRRVA